ncbi:hypothetical protein B0J14DRAFT_106506 [Halenospora varia]|nr:hypothetical protein B0J14DRAFT_106506 [Halenospora varia]
MIQVQYLGKLIPIMLCHLVSLSRTTLPRLFRQIIQPIFTTKLNRPLPSSIPTDKDQSFSHPPTMTPQPTPAEGHIFLTILLSMKNVPDVDWELVPQRLGYKSGVVARKRFQQIKIKIVHCGREQRGPTRRSN